MARNSSKRSGSRPSLPEPAVGLKLIDTQISSPASICSITWSADGSRLATGDRAGNIRIWNAKAKDGYKTALQRLSVKTEARYERTLRCLCWSPKRDSLLCGMEDGSIRHIGLNDSSERTIDLHDEWINNIAWSPETNLIASTSRDNTTLVWSLDKPNPVFCFNGKYAATAKASWEQSSKFLVFSDSRRLLTFNPQTWQLVRELRPLDSSEIISCAISKNTAAISNYRAIKIFDLKSGALQFSIEAHTEIVTALAFSSCGRFLASKSRDYTVKIWETATWSTVADFYEPHPSGFPSILSFHPKEPILATFGAQGETELRLWHLSPDVLLRDVGPKKALHYTTARVALVGDSGVGKTGLGWRIATGEFREHPSTHGQQFWHIDSLANARSDGALCQVVLWDLAGQPDYRIVHSLFLEDIDLALLVFDPTHPRDPLAAVQYWLSQLSSVEHRSPSSILVAARSDRGAPTLTSEQLDDFCTKNGIRGGAVVTSAMTGDGMDALISQIRDQINWNILPTTVTTQTFHRIREYLLSLKQEPEQSRVLIGMLELERRLKSADPNWKFTVAEMITAIRHLASHGYVQTIESTQAEQFVLLVPELLSNLASSIVVRARANKKGLGALDEGKIREDRTLFEGITNISSEEQTVLMGAVLALLLKRNVCFRETTAHGSLLIFPHLINLRRPEAKAGEISETVAYRVKGATENVYAALVVLLGYTDMFIRKAQWSDQAHYTLDNDELCGFRRVSEEDNAVEFVLQFGSSTSGSTRLLFQGLFERLLARREVDVTRFQPVWCSSCNEPFPMSVIRDRLAKGADFSFCSECGTKNQLPSPEPITVLPRDKRQRVRSAETVADRRTAFETALVHIKALISSRKSSPSSCFISYSWGSQPQERWVFQFARDLKNADFDVIFDRWENRLGDDLGRFIDRIQRAQFVLPVGTPTLLSKYDSQTSDPVVAAELELINYRVSKPNLFGRSVIPILLEGNADKAFPPQLAKLTRADFRSRDNYFDALFDLIWRMHDLPMDDKAYEELRKALNPDR